MGALLWFAKMLLKILKPFAKLAILEALFGALEEYTKGTEEVSEEPSEEETEPAL